VVHVTAKTKHSNEDLPGEPVVVYVIHYHENILPASLDRVLGSQSITLWNLFGSRSQMARSVRQDLQQMLFEQVVRRDGWEALIISLLIQLSVRLLRLKARDMEVLDQEPSSTVSSLQRVAQYAANLETSFYQQESLDEAAAKVGLSRRHFTALFRRLTGRSWRQHLLALRLNHGAKLLIQTNKSVTEVMFECGFDDLSHFHHHFKSTFGHSPLSYRQARCPKPQSGLPENPRPGGLRRLMWAGHVKRSPET
jgi:AraC family L-rhamnose operon regulatory protein RhaS